MTLRSVGHHSNVLSRRTAVISKDEKQVSMTAGTREREGHGERQERLQNIPDMQNKQLSLGTSIIFYSFLLIIS